MAPISPSLRGTIPMRAQKRKARNPKKDGDTVTITLCTTRPEDIVCAQMLTTFEEEVLLNTEDLDSGTYAIDVNGTTSLFTID
jgi:hypothetical protein